MGSLFCLPQGRLNRKISLAFCKKSFWNEYQIIRYIAGSQQPMIMKTISILLLLNLIYLNGFSQNFSPENVVYLNDTPAYYQDQIIVKFNPILLDTAVINNREITDSTLYAFIKPAVTDIIAGLGYNTEILRYIHAYKIFSGLTLNEQFSISRLGDTVPIPKFWSTLLIEWNTEATGISFEDALDTLNKFPEVIEYACPNYVIVPLSNMSNDPKLQNDEQPNLYPQTTGGFPITDAHINIDGAWAITPGNKSIERKVRVGVFDTGINWRHDDFSEDGSNTWGASRVKGGFDYFNKTADFTNQPTSDYCGHGTWVAGIIGAIRNNETGIAGIAGGNAQDPEINTVLICI